MKRKSSVKFLEVILNMDENISRKDYIKTIEKKLAKNIGLWYRTKTYFDEISLKTTYFSYTHPYLNYAGIALTSTRTT